MSMTYEEGSNTEQGLVSEPTVDVPRRSSKRALVIGGLVALGLVAAFLHSKPQTSAPGDVDGVVNLDGAKACPKSDTAALASDCRCSKSQGKNECKAGKFCYQDSSCHDAAKKASAKLCPKSDTAPLASDCHCAKSLPTHPVTNCKVGKFCYKDSSCNAAAKPAPKGPGQLPKEETCAAYTCPEGLVQLMGSDALKRPKNDANCCNVCPQGWVQLGQTGHEAPGWGLSHLGATAPSMSNCANSCKENAACMSFKWNHATNNCIFMSAAESVVTAQTSKWGNVITCVEAMCTTTGLSTSGATAGVPCVFPFRYKGKTYHNCTHEQYNSMGRDGNQLDDQKLATWCATEVEHGEAVPGKWGHCSEACNSNNVLKDPTAEGGPSEAMGGATGGDSAGGSGGGTDSSVPGGDGSTGSGRDRD